MVTPAEVRSGKGHRDENFPVASRLIQPRHRAPILAFYEFVRTADDIADHATLPPADKLALLDRLEATLMGRSNEDPVGVALRSRTSAEAGTNLAWVATHFDAKGREAGRQSLNLDKGFLP